MRLITEILENERACVRALMFFIIFFFDLFWLNLGLIGKDSVQLNEVYTGVVSFLVYVSLSGLFMIILHSLVED